MELVSLRRRCASLQRVRSLRIRGPPEAYSAQSGHGEDVDAIHPYPVTERSGSAIADRSVRRVGEMAAWCLRIGVRLTSEEWH